ncbi:MAG: hypothetical protein ACHREM_07050 [Polyangiales bacterium]
MFRAIWWALVLPWLALAVLRALVRKFEAFAHLIASLHFVFTEQVQCPRGHQAELHGVFECRTCGGLFAGWAFQICPICQGACGHVSCAHENCGLSIRNPLV